LTTTAALALKEELMSRGLQLRHANRIYVHVKGRGAPQFTTIEELRKVSKEELLRIRGLGNKGVQEIIEVLNNDN